MKPTVGARHAFQKRTLGLLALAAFAAPLVSAQQLILNPNQSRYTWVSSTGRDSNDCTRRYPCATFQGALDKTAPDGQIGTLDSGEYGPVNIDKPVTIDGGNTLSSIGTEKRLASCGELSAICVATSGTVILRNLKVDYVPAHPEYFSPAISLRADGKLGTAPMVVHLEKMAVRTPGNVCIYSTFSPSTDRISGPASGDRISVSDTELLDCMSAAWVNTNATFDSVRIHGPGKGTNSTGISSFGNRSVSIRNVSVSDAGFGFIVGDRSDVTIENSLSFSNGVGLKADGGKIRLINTTVHLNKLGLEAIHDGTIVSWGNNHISGNDTNGEPTSTTKPI